MSSLTKIARELLQIDEDLLFRIGVRGVRADDFQLITYTQYWGSTAGGFDTHIGGCAMTLQRTYVLVPTQKTDKCFVYFGGQFAYSVPYSEAFMSDVRKEQTAPISEYEKYLEAAERTEGDSTT